MFLIIGLIVVVASIIIGYTMHGGKLILLWQPSEYIIILGAAIGATIIGNTKENLKGILKSFSYLFKTSGKTKVEFVEMLKFFFNSFKLMKQKGMLEIESHLENPAESSLFQQAPTLLKDKNSVTFIRDYLRMMTMGLDNPHQFEEIIDKDIEGIEHHTLAPAKALLTLSDAMPALGIVAAVLGVINTMKSISEPPEVLGGMIAAALVGTFFGVLVSYGLFGPMGNYISIIAEEKVAFYKCMKSGLISHLNANPPIISMEFMRKVIPEHLRPTFDEMESTVNETSETPKS